MQMEFCEKKFIAALGRTSCDLGLMLQATRLLFSVTQTHRASPKSWPWAPNSSPEREARLTMTVPWTCTLRRPSLIHHSNLCLALLVRVPSKAASAFKVFCQSPEKTDPALNCPLPPSPHPTRLRTRTGPSGDGSVYIAHLASITRAR